MARKQPPVTTLLPDEGTPQDEAPAPPTLATPEPAPKPEPALPVPEDGPKPEPTPPSPVLLPEEIAAVTAPDAPDLQIPTLEEVLGRGYGPEAAEAIVARQTALKALQDEAYSARRYRVTRTAEVWWKGRFVTLHAGVILSDNLYGRGFITTMRRTGVRMHPLP